MDLYSLLACPVCKSTLARQEETLVCEQCPRRYPIIDGIPVLLPDGTVHSTEHQHDLIVRQEYDPWIPRVVMQSLPASAIVLDLGAGNLALDLPNVIRMDVTLTPYVDVVGDAHALPFRPEVFDFVFSHAVIEHLRQPFLAAAETFNVLRNGGYSYGECNFVFPYHSFPHHYFNASRQGLEQVFSQYEKLRSGVAPYQMPSFAIRELLRTYLQCMTPSENPAAQEYQHLLQQVLDQPLQNYDLLFTEDAASNVAAGVFYFCRKAVGERSGVIPPIIHTLWEQEPGLRQQFPDLVDLGTANNILLWAKREGRQKYSALDDYFSNLVPFRKNATVTDAGQEFFNELPVVEPLFHAIPNPAAGLSTKEELDLRRQQEATLRRQVETLTSTIEAKNQHIAHLESLIRQIESGRVMRLLRRFSRNKQHTSADL